MSKRDQIIEKIKKLLRKASDKNGNANECKLAMMIAQRLIAEYKIDKATLDESDGKPNVERRYFKITKRAEEIPYISRIMQDYFQAKILYTTGTAYVYATADSVDNALYIAEFLYNNMRATIRAERRAAKEYFRLIDTRSFYLGFMLGVCDVLEKQNTELERASESYALICRTELAVVDSYIKEFVKPKDVSRGTKPPTDLNSFSRGRIRGQKTGIKTGLETAP